ncbi:MAG: hypothetical protein HY288_09600 [Planctomycetia bacterium]|nr:hypothetical protein [Planctomycetia bacterium]
MKTFALLRCSLFGAVLALAIIDGPLWAQSPAVTGGGVSNLDLQSQLEKGLKARRPVEFAYIRQVVGLIESGKLPRSVVISTFGRARQKPDRKLQYFQFALQARTKGLGIQLPNLKSQAVGIGSNGGQHGFGSP